MDMLWWHWAVLGLVLAALELASPGGFFIIFFGVGALVVGLLTFLGVGGPAWLQWLLFTILSLAALKLFRDPLLRHMRTGTATGPVDALHVRHRHRARRHRARPGRARRAAGLGLERAERRRDAAAQGAAVRGPQSGRLDAAHHGGRSLTWVH